MAKSAPKLSPYVTGPKRSRRFGLAINVQFGAAGESCLWDCIYCPWHGKKKKKSPAPKALELLDSLRRILKEAPKVETVLLGGNSEPTLHESFIEISKEVLKLRKQSKGKWKVILLTNGSGLDRDDVPALCNDLDRVFVKLDCAEDSLFKKMIHPKKGHDELDTYLIALKKLKNFGIQTTLWKYPDRHSFQNWSADNLKALLDLYQSISPAIIHLVTLKRNQRHEGTQPVSAEEMESFAQRISDLGLEVEFFS